MKRIVFIILTLAMVLTLTACGGPKDPATSESGSSAEAGEAAKSQTFKLSLANTQPLEDIETMAMVDCKKILEEKTDGAIECTVYPNSELGDTDDLVEQAAQGMAVMVPTDPARLSAYIPDFGILQMPYLFDDLEALDKFMQTDIYKKWDEEFLNHNIKVLAANWYGGARHVVCNKEIQGPADLKGLKIRTMKNKIAMESINALGAVATPMSQSEIYTAVEQKALDGAENQNTSTYANRFYEILKVINKTGHFTLIGVPVVGTPFYDSLPADYQKLMVDTFTSIGTQYHKIGLDEEARCEAEMEKLGVKFVEVDKTPFIQATEPVYDKLGYKDLREKLIAEIEAVK
jgi:tripartite ATP-independent transporter DctP family solute receptor